MQGLFVVQFSPDSCSQKVTVSISWAGAALAWAKDDPVGVLMDRVFQLAEVAEAYSP